MITRIAKISNRVWRRTGKGFIVGFQTIRWKENLDFNAVLPFTYIYE